MEAVTDLPGMSEEAASHPSALKVILVGVLVVVPLIIAYSAFSYRVFWGKARTGMYD